MSDFMSKFSAFERKFFFLRDILEEKSKSRMFFMDLVMGKKGRSFQNQRESNLISQAEGGSGLRARDWLRRMKDKQQVIKKKNI